MKSALFISILSSALLAGIVETNEWTFLQVFAQKTPCSNILAAVSSTKGKITTKHCFRISRDAGLLRTIAKLSDGFVVAGYSTSSNSYSKGVYLLRVDEYGNIN